MCTTTKSQEQQGNLHCSAEESNNSNSLVEIKQIDNTPFKAVRQEDKWFGVLGQYRITDKLANFDEVVEYIVKNKWEVILSMIICIIEQVKPWKEKND